MFHCYSSIIAQFVEIDYVTFYVSKTIRQHIYFTWAEKQGK